MRWTMITKRSVFAAALAFTFAASRPAYADNTSLAETLFQEGLAAMKKNDYATACEAFAGSNRADASPGTQINLAICYEKQKRWASAWAWYKAAAGLAEQKGQPERVSLATKEADRVKPLIHYVVVSVKPPPDGLLVRRDGEEVQTTLGGKELPIPFDPGDHQIEVSAPGKKPWSTTLKTPDSPSTERLEVPPLETAQGAGASGGNAPEAPGPVVIKSDGGGQRTVGIVVAGAGLLGGLAAVGVYFLGAGEDDKGDQFTAQADGTTDPAQKAELTRVAGTRHDAASNDRLIAILSGAGGAILIGVGAFLYFTAPKSAAASGRPRVLPAVAPGYAGLGVGGSF
jgi:hypothetical protein